MSRYSVFAILSLVSIVASGCSTSSKVDKFLAEADQQIQAQKILETQSSTLDTGSQSVSDPLDSIATSTTENPAFADQIGYYKEYDQTTFTTAQSEGRRIVLFFHAGRCPSCVALEKSLNTNISSLPKDVAVLKIDYDNASDLKFKYNVSEQNTIIILNPDGTESKRASGGIYKIENLLTYL